MKQFKRIALIDISSLSAGELHQLQTLSEHPIIPFPKVPKNELQTSALLENVDCALVSLLVDLSSQVINQAPHLRYLGVAGTSLRRLDLEAFTQRGIHVANVKGYCDSETAEFVLLELLTLVRSLGPDPRSLSGKTLGIVGLGGVGAKLSHIALSLGMQVSYFSPHRKLEFEARGISYRPLSELLGTNEILSIHVPPDTKILTGEEFKLISPGTVIVNTSLGDVFDEKSFREWFPKSESVVIFDEVSGSRFRDLANGRSLIVREEVAGFTAESKNRRSQAMIDQVRAFLNASDSN